MDDAEIKAKVRLLAIEYMLAHVYNKVNFSLGANEAVIEEVEARSMERLSKTVVGGDPAWSDHLSAEMQEAVRALQVLAKSMRASG